MTHSSENDQNKIPRYSWCTVNRKICNQSDGHGPDFCPTIHFDAVIKEALREYKKPQIEKFAYYAVIQEGDVMRTEADNILTLPFR